MVSQKSIPSPLWGEGKGEGGSPHLNLLPKGEKKPKSLKVKIGKMTLKNPVMVASGTFGYGEELSKFCDASKLGAVVTKTITLNPRAGNPTPRVVETPSGMLNSIGLENKGLRDFVFHKIPVLNNLNTHIIVSIAGDSLNEFFEITDEISRLKCVSGIELNLSCPNISHKSQVRAERSGAVRSLPARGSPRGTSHKLIAQDKIVVKKVVPAIRKKTKLTLITKLSPNVTDIKEIAKACEDAGSDAISLINTIFGASIDIETRKSRLGRISGGLSGPAIKPIALNFVREAYKAVKIPIIGIGGIMTAEDALEFIICGASAIQVGTANFINPASSIHILNGIIAYLKRNRIRNINSLVGSLKTQT